MFTVQAVAFMLAEMAMETELSRLAVMRSCFETEQGRRNTVHASFAKAFSADAANRAASNAVQVKSVNFTVALLLFLTLVRKS